MFSFLKKLKKVKKVPSERLKNDGSAMQIDHLFWAEKVQNVTEDGLKFAYKHMDCFFGNSETYVRNENSNVVTYMMRKLTGTHEGEMFMPDIEDMDFVIEVPSTEGGVDKYVIDIMNDFDVGTGRKETYTMEEIVTYSEKVNSARKAKAKAGAKKIAELKQKQ